MLSIPQDITEKMLSIPQDIMGSLIEDSFPSYSNFSEGHTDIFSSKWNTLGDNCLLSDFCNFQSLDFGNNELKSCENYLLYSFENSKESNFNNYAYFSELSSSSNNSCNVTNKSFFDSPNLLDKDFAEFPDIHLLDDFSGSTDVFNFPLEDEPAALNNVSIPMNVENEIFDNAYLNVFLDERYESIKNTIFNEHTTSNCDGDLNITDSIDHEENDIINGTFDHAEDVNNLKYLSKNLHTENHSKHGISEEIISVVDSENINNLYEKSGNHHLPAVKTKLKREQNKKAATKYRQKLRKEKGNFELECALEENKNKELKIKIEDLNKEIKYISNLLLEINSAT